jgi:hypothetical protein
MVGIGLGLAALDLDLRTQFDDAVRREIEVLDHAAGVTRHGGEHAFAPQRHAVGAHTRYHCLTAQEVRCL